MLYRIIDETIIGNHQFKFYNNNLPCAYRTYPRRSRNKSKLRYRSRVLHRTEPLLPRDIGPTLQSQPRLDRGTPKSYKCSKPPGVYLLARENARSIPLTHVTARCLFVCLFVSEKEKEEQNTRLTKGCVFLKKDSTQRIINPFTLLDASI